LSRRSSERREGPARVSKPAPSRKSAGANEVRIVGGTWRSRRIRFTPLEGLRPTPDRVRETLFNWLGQDLTGLACLDLFAGSGALGFEAASRNAARVVMVERDHAAFESLRANKAALDASCVELVRRDALEFVRGAQGAGPFDVVFLDPPFDADYWARLIPLLPPLLQSNARVYCESGAAVDGGAGWEVMKDGRAGHVTYQLLRAEE
jgi:16S rRNA (guanine966-N2)-methyltransferase